MSRFLRLAIVSCTILVFISGNQKLKSQIRINEFLAINNTILADSDGDFSDWIELYNGGSAPVSLLNWVLTDDATASSKWYIPDVEIGPGDYLIIFASGKDRGAADQELHANFKLSGGGEFLALIDDGGQEQTSFTPQYPAQREDISYGYYGGKYVNFSVPTPGAENSSSSVIITPPSFSVPHGMIRDAFQLEILSEFPDGEIYYTLDGSEPTTEEGDFYSAPISVASTTVIRAVVVLNNTDLSEVITASYIFPEKILSQNNSPEAYPDMWGPYTAITGTAIADYEMDPEMLSDETVREQVLEALWGLPSLSLVTDLDNLFSHVEDEETGGIYIYTGPPLSRTEDGVGKGWERPASMELYDSTGDTTVQINCGIRLQGGHSRRPEKSPKHSFRIVFKDEYGPTRLNFPIFQDEDATTSFNSLVLRAGFSLSWVHHSHGERKQAQYVQDIWAKDTQRELGHASSRSEFVHLYLNGLYWGIYALSERVDGDFAESYMDGDKEEFDVIKDYQDVVDGSIDSWNQLMDMANAGLQDNEAYQKIQGKSPDGVPNPAYESLVDVESLVDYMLINFYGGNTDWDHHNWAAINNREDYSQGYHFLCWDSEHILKSLNQNVIDENNEDCPSRVFQQLRENEEFRIYFADRVHMLCYNGGALDVNTTVRRWDKRSEVMEPVVQAEAARWGDYRRDVHSFQAQGPFDLYDYDPYWLDMRSFLTDSYFPQRTAILLDQLRNAGLYPSLEAPLFFINGEDYPVENTDRGDMLSMESEEGLIYYTLNGKDPADFVSGDENDLKLFTAGTDKYIRVPSSDLGVDWYSSTTYNHSDWTLSTGLPGGVGYEEENGYEDLISMDMKSLMSAAATDPNATCYVRIPFNLENTENLTDKILLLQMQYDDGFAAFLNGVRVAEANAPITLSWNSVANLSHEHEIVENFDISEWIHLLEEGDNLLAIQAMNMSTTSSDFIINAALTLKDASSAEVSDDAVLYTDAFALDMSASVVARTWLNGTWSAAMRAGFAFTEDLQDLRLTEIHYRPLGEEAEDGTDFEFLELKNVGSATLNLGGVSFQDGVSYVFPEESMLAPGEFSLLASKKSNFAARYGFYPHGDYKGNLNNAGEYLRLESPDGDTIFNILYDDVSPWPHLEDFPGHSIVPIEFDPPQDQTQGSDWRASVEAGGSPGRDDLLLSGPEVEIVAGQGLTLAQNYPNPFRDQTWFSYSLEEDSRVELSVFNLTGQKLAVLQSGNKHAGSHIFSWDGQADGLGKLTEGIYLYRLDCSGSSGLRSLTRKFVIIQ